MCNEVLMKRQFIFFVLLLSVQILKGQPSETDEQLQLWYDEPAYAWEEALPLGNGKTGAMVFGEVGKERFQLNDNTLWSGYPQPGNNPNGTKYLPLVREAVEAGDYTLAAKYWKKMQGPYSARYLHMANLFLDLNLKDTIVSKYRRTLDLNNAIASVAYDVNGIRFHRESFISYPDKVMVVRITASRKGSINLNAWLDSKLMHTSSATSATGLVLKGKAPMHVANRDSEPLQIVYDERENGEGMRFEIHVKVKAEGGTVNNTDTSLRVSNADAVTLYLTEDTSFNGFNKSPGLEGRDPSIEAFASLQKAMQKTYEELRSSHIADYQQLFHRIRLDLGKDPAALKLPIDQRMHRLNQGADDHHLQT
jgi:alpha-L-fucosidase 2